MDKINIPLKLCAYARKSHPNWEAWTQERVVEWTKVTEKLRPIINNLDHDIYLCSYSCEEGYMTTKPKKEE